MDKSKYPYWSVAALSPSNPFYIAGPISGCGQCFEIQCLDSGGQYAVGYTLLCVSALFVCKSPTAILVPAGVVFSIVSCLALHFLAAVTSSPCVFNDADSVIRPSQVNLQCSNPTDLS